MSTTSLSGPSCLLALVAYSGVWIGLTFLLKFIVNYFLVKFHYDVQFTFWEVAGALFLLGVIGGTLFKSSKS